MFNQTTGSNGMCRVTRRDKRRKLHAAQSETLSIGVSRRKIKKLLKDKHSLRRYNVISAPSHLGGLGEAVPLALGRSMRVYDENFSLERERTNTMN